MHHILLADDNHEIQRLVALVLGTDGYEVVAVENGAQAIEQLEAATFDAILLDLMMPVASGWDVLQWLTTNQPDVAKRSVIVLTAAVRELKGVDPASVYAVVTKPFDVFQLQSLVRACVGRA